MIKYLHAFVFLLFPLPAFAQSIPPTLNTVPAVNIWRSDDGLVSPHVFGSAGGTRDNLCQAIATAKNWQFWSSSGNSSTGYCYLSQPGRPSWDFYTYVKHVGTCATGTKTGAYPNETCQGVPTCPSGYNYNAATNMCDPEQSCPMYGTPEGNAAPTDKPAGCNCPSGHEWVPMNGCRAKCSSYPTSGETVNGGWPFTFPKGQIETCFNGCVVQQGGGESFVYDDGSVTSPATSTGWACQTSGETPPPSVPEVPQKPKEPPCGASEGVLTSSSGKVACIPEGTPAPRKPDVKVREKKETFPDNSTKTTTETKTTDPKTSASHTHTTTTSSGGMAGPAGTTEGTESETGDGDGDGGDGDGDCEGDDCGEGEYTPGEFPETEGLYSKKYENGIQGVLDARYAEVQNSQLFSLVGKLIPTNVPNSGTCSPFSMSMNIGAGMNFGGGNIEFPCYVWTFIRVVMLISALLLARRLIFGG